MSEPKFSRSQLKRRQKAELLRQVEQGRPIALTQPRRLKSQEIKLKVEQRPKPSGFGSGILSRGTPTASTA